MNKYKCHGTHGAPCIWLIDIPERGSSNNACNASLMQAYGNYLPLVRAAHPTAYAYGLYFDHPRFSPNSQ